mmetsp:Transcript_35926/g.86824  ORF Transcript_35926/g.86824 Transcript_35926/m.86824 type:complete len:224 (+) Transcript_35926:1425-2096(+)
MVRKAKGHHQVGQISCGLNWSSFHSSSTGSGSFLHFILAKVTAFLHSLGFCFMNMCWKSIIRDSIWIRGGHWEIRVGNQIAIFGLGTIVKMSLIASSTCCVGGVARSNYFFSMVDSRMMVFFPFPLCTNQVPFMNMCGVIDAAQRISIFIFHPMVHITSTNSDISQRSAIVIEQFKGTGTCNNRICHLKASAAYQCGQNNGMPHAGESNNADCGYILSTIGYA